MMLRDDFDDEVSDPTEKSNEYRWMRLIKNVQYVLDQR